MIVVDAMDDPVQARTDPVVRLEVEDDPVQPVLGQRPDQVATGHPGDDPHADVVDEADFSGSTAAMSDYVTNRQPARVVLITECSMADNVAVLHPKIDFVRPCNLCPHMKRITLSNIRGALETMRHEVTIDAAVAVRARRAVERMLAV